jgi:small-conductance mechanosensitive channel
VIKFVSDLRQVGGFSPLTLGFPTNKSDRHDITEILLKVAKYHPSRIFGFTLFVVGVFFFLLLLFFCSFVVLYYFVFLFLFRNFFSISFNT